MRKVLFLLLCVVSAQAQFNTKPYNQFSIESGVGYSMPMSGVSVNDEGSLGSLGHFNAGVRYMFNQDFGTKFTLQYDAFRDGDFGSNHTRFNLEAYYNVGNLFDLTFKTYEAVALYMHAGVGLGLIRSVNDPNSFDYPGSGNDRQGQVIIGLSPRFRITEKVSLFADFSYFTIFKQHVYYNGQRFTPDSPSDFEPGQGASHMTFSFGLVYNLGKRRYHADWY
jgi:OOP family OmpA-OmpF porin